MRDKVGHLVTRRREGPANVEWLIRMSRLTPTGADGAARRARRGSVVDVGWKDRKRRKDQDIGDAAPGSRAVKRAVANDGARAGVSNDQPASQCDGGTAVSLGSR